MVVCAGGTQEGLAVEAAVTDDDAFALRALSNAIKECSFGFGEIVTAFEKVKAERHGSVAEHERRA